MSEEKHMSCLDRTATFEIIKCKANIRRHFLTFQYFGNGNLWNPTDVYAKYYLDRQLGSIRDHKGRYNIVLKYKSRFNFGLNAAKITDYIKKLFK